MTNRERREGEGSTAWTPVMIALALMGAALQVRPARAESNRRELGDHLFLLTPLIRDPFATTYFDMRTIEGLATSQGLLFDPTGTRTGTRDYNLAVVAESLEYQLALADWLAARVGATAFVYSGSSALALLAVGAVLRYEVSAGLTASYQLNQRLRVGFTFDLNYGRRDSIDILSAVSQSVQQGQVGSVGLLQTSQVLVLAPGITGAFALHRSLGLVLALYYSNAGLSTGSLPTGNQTLAPGLSLDFDLGAFLPVPIGFLAAYRWDVPLDGGGQTQTADLGVFYTGRRDLNLGLEIGWRHFPLRRDFRADAGLAALVMRYYW